MIKNVQQNSVIHNFNEIFDCYDRLCSDSDFSPYVRSIDNCGIFNFSTSLIHLGFQSELQKQASFKSMINKP